MEVNKQLSQKNKQSPLFPKHSLPVSTLKDVTSLVKWPLLEIIWCLPGTLKTTAISLCFGLKRCCFPVPSILPAWRTLRMALRGPAQHLCNLHLAHQLPAQAEATGSHRMRCSRLSSFRCLKMQLLCSLHRCRINSTMVYFFLSWKVHSWFNVYSCSIISSLWHVIYFDLSSI